MLFQMDQNQGTGEKNNLIANAIGDRQQNRPNMGLDPLLGLSQQPSPSMIGQ